MSTSDSLDHNYGMGGSPLSLTILSIGMCVGWLVNYIATIRKSFQDRTYGMALMPLCCNIACEFVYGVIFPPDIPLWPCIFAGWLTLNLIVIYAAMKFAPNEWSHAPLVERNISWIFVVTIGVWMSAHLTLVAHVGKSAGAAWSSWFCQLLLSAGGVCQLIVRGSTRGTSLFIWFSRFIGTVLALPHEILRYRYGYTDVVWHSPLGWWGGVMFFLLDGSYGILLWSIRRSEARFDETALRNKKTAESTGNGIMSAGTSTGISRSRVD
ncbi:hypothetical protein N7466_003143 [Penicillium verhagenii]|uniref:uncharacterized protein n=1 Tax=Penicillium verhagenii TaxID=1562060 RepID=UPI002545996E|nr:uncharacterized protein N7466_003143 [Penicillium verhagenii]KAJ5936693.1 hypothetical protein N7466_003143 [Penicillium verhagenii]